MAKNSDIAEHTEALKAHTVALKANSKVLKMHAKALASATAIANPAPGGIYSQGPCVNGVKTVWRYDEHLQPTLKSEESC